MITLAWVLFWLALYLPGYAPHSTVEVGTLPKGTVGWASYCGGGTVANACPYNKITIDIDQIQTYNNYLYGPWDRIVFTACIIVHEQAHIDTQSGDHLVPFTRQLDCLEHFYAIAPTGGIAQMMRWPRDELSHTKPPVPVQADEE